MGAIEPRKEECRDTRGIDGAGRGQLQRADVDRDGAGCLVAVLVLPRGALADGVREIGTSFFWGFTLVRQPPQGAQDLPQETPMLG